METTVFDGKTEALKIRETVTEEAAQKGLKPNLAVFLVGQNPASESYIRQKQKACVKAGFGWEVRRLPETSGIEEIQRLLQTANCQPQTHGIILQLPLPSLLSRFEKPLLNTISPNKDIDGLTPNSSFTPPVALAVLYVLKKSGLETSGAKTLVLGRGATAGAPIAKALQDAGAQIFVAHSQTPLSIVKCQMSSADIVVSCVGRAHIVTGEMIKDGAAVIGVGISRLEEPKMRASRPEGVPLSDRSISKVAGRDKEAAGPATVTRPVLVGDLDEDSLIGRARLITPTPGGIGPLTVAFLLSNLLTAAKKAAKESHLTLSAV